MTPIAFFATFSCGSDRSLFSILWINFLHIKVNGLSLDLNRTFDEDLLWNLAYHEVYLAINLFGTPISIKILEQNSIKTDLDLVKFKMDFKKRGRIIKCFFEINRHSPKKIKQIEFVLLKKKLIWEDDFLLQKNKMRKVLFKSKDKPLTLMCRKFIHKIENNDRSDPQEKVAKKAIGVIQRINQLAKR